MDSTSACKCLSKVYDVIAQIISILDVTTDVIVCIGFFQDDRMAFFGISLSILLIALICYSMAFVAAFGTGNDKDKINLFFAVLPISPLVPFILYFASDKDDCLAKFMERNCCLKIKTSKIDTGSDISALRKFFEEKIEK